MAPRGGGRKRRGGWRGGASGRHAGRTRTNNGADTATSDSDSGGLLDASPLIAALGNGAAVDDNLSDVSDLSADEADDLMATGVPARGTLEREAGKLRARFKSARRAFFTEQLADLDKRITEAQAVVDAEAAKADGSADTQPESVQDVRVRNAHERHRLRVACILEVYRHGVQAALDEMRLGEAAILASLESLAALKRRVIPSAPESESWLEDDLAKIVPPMST